MADEIQIMSWRDSCGTASTARYYTVGSVKRLMNIDESIDNSITVTNGRWQIIIGKWKFGRWIVLQHRAKSEKYSIILNH